VRRTPGNSGGIPLIRGGAVAFALAAGEHPPNYHRGEDGSRYRYHRINYCFFSILRKASLCRWGRFS
jgi:hypothetical protein